MRVLVIGPSGAGKSTLAMRLRDQTGLPLIHLDREFWRPGWVEPDKTAWAAQVAELVTRETWIMDGNYSGTLAPRIAAADVIVFLDLPRWQCLLGVFARWWQWRGRVRTDLAPGCPEQFPSLDFLRFIWRYEQRSRPKVLALLDAARATKRVIVLRSRAEVNGFSVQDQTY